MERRQEHVFGPLGKRSNSRFRREKASARLLSGVLTLLVACCSCALALDPSLDINQYAHATWKIGGGLTNGTITSIAQTPDGYLWLGTEFGLFRFDGVRSVPWQPRGSEHLPSSLIGKLLVSRDGTLWIGTHKGLASWKDGKLTLYLKVPGMRVDSLLEDHEGTIWAGVEVVPTWRLCSIQSGRVQCYGENGSLGLGVGTLFEDRTGNVWAGTGTGLWRWKPHVPERIPLSGPASEIHALSEGDNGALLATTRGGIIQLVDGKPRAYPLQGTGPEFNPFWLLRDRNGGLWIGTLDRGLLHMHQGRTDQYRQTDGLSSDSIEHLFEDREGNVWVGTSNGFDHFHDLAVTAIPVKQGLANAYVESVLPARDGSVWLGTRNGLDRWDDGRLTLYRKHRAQALGTESEITDSGLPDDYQSSLFQDHRGRIWVFSRGGPAHLERGRFIPVRAMPGGYAHSIAEDSAGDLWICQDQGLFHLLRGSVVEQIPWARLGPQGLALALAADPLQGGLWLGFSEGGVAYFKDGQIRALYGAADGLGEGRVNSVQFDQDGTLWAATEGGLSQVKNGHVITLSSQNGLPCDAVHWVMEDDARSVWLYTACGLVRVARPQLDAWVENPKRKIQATVFDNTEGLKFRALRGGLSPRFGKSSDGRLWYVSGGGVFVVDPLRLDRRQFSFNKLPPPVHIEQVKVDGKIWDAARGWRLPARVRDVWIDYTALSLVAPEKVHFRYKLEGQDPDWKEVVNDREAQYSNLPPRNYRFRVMACNNSGVWNEAGDTLDFSIDPAYYQTAWFRASVVAAFLLLLWALYRYRMLQIAHEFNARLEGRVDERIRVARELHDTLLQSFQGLMLRFQVVNELLPPGKAKEALEKALERGDRAIAEGRDSIHDLRSSTVLTNDLALAVRALADELASQDSATFRLVVEGPARNLHPILRDEIYRIAREALRNAFRHAQARQIEAEITYSDRLFRLRIRDDGQGIAPAILEEGRGGHYGLPGMRERATQIGAKLNIWSGGGAGTEIDLSIPGSIAYVTSPGRRGFRLFRKKAG